MKPRTIQTLSLALFALLLLWGIFTLLYYVGTGYHNAALLTDAKAREVLAACESGSTLCRGVRAFVPAILHTFARAAPFLWYGIVSLLVFALFAGWQWFKTERKSIRIVWAPWKIVLFFVAAVWLFSTVLSFGSMKGISQRTYVEPLKETYNVSEHALASLQKEYQNLLVGGCLSPIGQTAVGAKVYSLRVWCIEAAFVQRVLPQVLFVLLLLGEFLVLGRMALGWLRYTSPSPLHEALFSTGLGASVGIAILWTVAVAGIFTAAVGWALALLIPAVGFRHTRYWVRQFLFHRWESEYRWTDVSLLLSWLLLSYLALNFLQVVRPFPIGWDDLGSYLNRPRQLVSYGRFVASMSPFDWSYLTSLGFLLLGFNTPVGATASMMVNWSAGLLAVIAIVAFARTFLGPRAGVLAALLYYTLPLIGHFSYADMKIDNAIFFFGVLATLAVMMAVLPRETDGDESRNTPAVGRFLRSPQGKLLLLAGVFAGIAFATKVTAIMVILPLGALLIGALLDWRAFVGLLLLSGFLYLWRGVLSAQLVAARILATPDPPAWIGPSITFLLFATGTAFVAWSLWKHRSALRPAILLTAAFALGFTLAVLPWAEHNAIESGSILPSPIGAAINRLSPKIDVDALPGELATDKSSPACGATGVFEELDRYWGFGKGWSHYLLLPWRAVMNLDATGYYVTTVPALLLLPLLLLLPYFWSRQGKWLRWLTGITAMILFEWVFLGNGIPWYGIGMLLGIVIGLEALAAKAPDLQNRIAAGTLLAFSLLIAFNLRFWQFEQQRNIFEYSMGKISADALREITIPWYDGISAEVVARYQDMPDRPYLYRIGTFIPYFIPRNLEIIGINDHQLDVFNCLYQERDPELTVRRLKHLKFNSIIFDTNTATIERDEQGSLHKKVNSFVDFVNNPASKLQVIVSDTGAGIAFILIP